MVFLLFFSIRVDLLLGEKRLSGQMEIILQEEYYFFSSVKKLENTLKSKGTISTKGTIKYINGDMDYQTASQTGTLQTIDFTLRLNSGITVIGRGYFDTKLKKITKWVEKN
jgi:competence protein ComGG